MESHFAKYLETDLEDLRYRCYETHDEGYRRIDERSYNLTKLPADFAVEKEWPWVKAIGHSLRVTIHSDGREMGDVRYYNLCAS